MKNKESYYKRTKSFLYIFYLILWGINWENRRRSKVVDEPIQGVVDFDE